MCLAVWPLTMAFVVCSVLCLSMQFRDLLNFLSGTLTPPKSNCWYTTGFPDLKIYLNPKRTGHLGGVLFGEMSLSYQIVFQVKI